MRDIINTKIPVIHITLILCYPELSSYLKTT